LLLDPEFRRYIEERLSPPQPDQEVPSSVRFVGAQIDHHISVAIALLVEGGVRGELAADALRSVANELTPSPGPFREPNQFFQRLRDAEDAACDLADSLRAEAAAEDARIRLRRLGFAAAGLALVGLTGSALALVAAPAVAFGVAAVGGGGAIVNAIGMTMFDHNVGRARRDDW
jgi:hypothetical protein